jgi:hypothetical protein
MPLYRNHSRRSRDAPVVMRDQLNSNSQVREVNRTSLDAKRCIPDSDVAFLHPERGPNIQTFCLPVSLIPLTPMTDSLSCASCRDTYARRGLSQRRCCRETIA